ncbi:MAG: VCBS repeat-containing protein, partial [Thermoguttaceae bacterium]|nr:VCBS repeat-containing protein [Thermoguttaceae bacterium]
RSGQWEIWKIDETLTVLHGLWVGDLDADRRDEILTASFEGIYRFDLEGGAWRKTHLGAGAPPVSDKPGAARGSSEVAPGRLGPNRPFVAAIEPWHGHQVVIYTPPDSTGPWHRRVIDESLVEGHALVVADFDDDGQDEIVAGWRGGDRGLRLYDPLDAEARQFRTANLDRGIAVEGAVVADLNADGRPDLVVIAGRTNDLVWYENLAR